MTHTRYVMFHNTTMAEFRLRPGHTVDDLERMFTKMERLVNVRREPGGMSPVWSREHDEVTPNGLRYFWQLSGPDGAHYELLLLPGTSKEAEAAARSWLRMSFDVVRLTTQRVTRIIEVPADADGFSVLT